jgi:cytochrome c peroxidase
MVRVALLLAGVAVAAGCVPKDAPPPPPPAPASPPKPTASTAAAKSFYAPGRFSRRPSPAAMTELGRRLFFDPQISVSGSTQLGGPDLGSADRAV